MYSTLQKKNPDLPLYPITHESFEQFGRIIDGYDFTPWLDAMQNTPVPAEGTVYVPDLAELSLLPLASEVQQRLYGGMPIQVGYCNGTNSKMNAMEYHKTPELNVAATDLILLLADMRDIQNNTFDSSAVTAYYMPAGMACELHGTTLHFAPCCAREDGFQNVVVLPLGVNLPLEQPLESPTGEDKLLYMKGKWLIAHEESIPASKGAYVGITGKNLEVFF